MNRDLPGLIRRTSCDTHRIDRCGERMIPASNAYRPSKPFSVSCWGSLPSEPVMIGGHVQRAAYERCLPTARRRAVPRGPSFRPEFIPPGRRFSVDHRLLVSDDSACSMAERLSMDVVVNPTLEYHSAEWRGNLDRKAGFTGGSSLNPTTNRARRRLIRHRLTV